MADVRRQSSFSPPIFCIGFLLLSITYSSLAAAFYPALFTSLILVDPVITSPNDRTHRDHASDLAFGALRRRDTWPSRYDPHSKK